MDVCQLISAAAGTTEREKLIKVEEDDDDDEEIDDVSDRDDEGNLAEKDSSEGVIHPVNLFLPSSQRSNILNEDHNNWKEIIRISEKLTKDESKIVDKKLLGRLLQLMSSRLTLKYWTTTEQFSFFCQLLITTIQEKQVIIPLRVKCFDMMCRVFHMQKNIMSITINLKEFWEQLVQILHRENRYSYTCSENLNAKHFESLAKFIHCYRHFISEADANDVLSDAMKLLENQSSERSILGLQQLVLCLPTRFAKYDLVIERWIDLFCSIGGNELWDGGWLTLFCRSRKHSDNWATWLQKIAPILFTKLRSLMNLPSTFGKTLAHDRYPKSCSTYYWALSGFHANYRKNTLKKLAKLLYCYCYCGEMVPAPSLSIRIPTVTTSEPICFEKENVNINFGLLQFSLFLQSIRTYFNPSNSGGWSTDIGYFLQSVIDEYSKNVGDHILAQQLKQPLLPHSPRLHLGICNFLSQLFLTYVVEALYSKNPILVQSCAVCLKNLCSIDPKLGDIIVPFLLDALDEKSVDHGHMAPIALMCLQSCCKSLLFPHNKIFSYLPRILPMTLPGLDPNDTKKSIATLSFYSALLSWLPRCIVTENEICSTTEKFKENYGKHSSGGYLQLACGDLVSVVSNAILEDELIEVVIDRLNQWGLQYVDRLLCILRVKEEKDNHQQWPLGTYILESFELFCKTLSPPYHQAILEKILQCKNNLEYGNSAKELGKLLECLISVAPSLLHYTLKSLIDEDLLRQVCSVSKIQLRMRLICGAVRFAESSYLLQSFHLIDQFFRPCFFFSTEYEIRKSACKLLKDFLRGLTSFYPTLVHGQAIALGTGCGLQNSTFHWNSPSSASIDLAGRLICEHGDPSLSAINNMTTGERPNAILLGNNIVNKKEDLLAANLSIIRSILRGTAEVLSDTKSKISISTGRNGIDSEILKSFRIRVLTVLNELNSKRDINETLVESPVVRTISLKIFKILFTQRMAGNKHPDRVKKWHSFSRRNKLPTLLGHMVKAIRHLVAIGANVDNYLADFWIYHDVSQKNIADRPWIQHLLRQREYSFAELKGTNNRSSHYMEALHIVGHLCGSEFDTVRTLAAEVFHESFSRFGQNVDAIIESRLRTVSSGDYTFDFVLGTLIIVTITMKRVCNDLLLLVLFSTVMKQFPLLLLQFTDQEKVAKLNDRLGNAVLTYLKLYHQFPLIATLPITQQFVNCLQDLVSSFFHGENGFKYNLYISCFVLSFVGHPELSINMLSSWAVNAICKFPGQPIHQIALSWITRQIFILEVMDRQCDWIDANSVPSVLRALLYGHNLLDRSTKPQWAAGVDSILRYSEYIRMSLSRRVTACYDLKLFSQIFKPQNAHLVYCLLKVGASKCTIAETISIFLESASQLLGNNDEENRAANASKAEIFAGILIYVAKIQITDDVLVSQLNDYFIGAINKVSMDYCADWSEAIAFAIFNSKHVLPLFELCFSFLMNESFTEIIQRRSASFSTGGDEGFAQKSKYLFVIRAVVQAEYYLGDNQRLITPKVLATLHNCDPYSLFTLQYSSIRIEIGILLGLLVNDMTPDFTTHLENFLLILDLKQTPNSELKLILETVGAWAEYFITRTIYKHCKALPQVFCKTLLDGCCNVGDNEISKKCRELLLAMSLSVYKYESLQGYEKFLLTLARVDDNVSVHVRELCRSAAALSLINNRNLLSNLEMQLLKNLFFSGLIDASPEVQHVARLGMISYLNGKSSNEIKVLSVSYIKNSDAFIVREKALRKKANAVEENRFREKSYIDSYVTTVMMLSSLVLLYPYDLPDFLPTLVCSICKHTNIAAVIVPPLRRAIIHTLQEFKRTHQDRWSEFSHQFTLDELQELQGCLAGASHYFS